jgi:TctA family transporter
MFPLAAVLAGIGLVLIYRIDAELAREQAQWFVAGLAFFCVTILLIGDHHVLERYRYTIAAASIALLLMPRLPGIGSQVVDWLAYGHAAQTSKDAKNFGKGDVRGVLGPGAANNSKEGGDLVPTIAFGVPGSATMALMLGALTIQGIQPGPQVMTQRPDLFWGLIASMWIGNLMLVVLNLPLIGLWVSLLRVPYRLMFPAILMFCCIGIYSVNNAPLSSTRSRSSSRSCTS